jgi:hypothetical protein
MGTRGTITFIFNGKIIKVYNHWDSYPSGLGVKLINELQILLKAMSIDEIIEKFNKIKILAHDYQPTDEDIEKLQKYTDLSVSRQTTNDVYCLLRHTQGSIIKILDAGYVSNYEGDEDYNYTIDFDEKKILVDGNDWGNFDQLSMILDKFML